MSDRLITELASAVADRDDIDWSTVQRRLATAEARRLASELATLSGLSADQPTGLHRAARPCLPLVLEVARFAAITVTALGLAQYTLTLAELEAPLFLVLVAAFAAAAFLIEGAGADERARSLAASYWMVAAAFAGSGLFLLARQLDTFWMWVVAGMRPESFLAAALWQFARDFPRVTRFGRIDACCAAAVRLASAAGVFLFSVNLGAALAPSIGAVPGIAALLRFPGTGLGYSAAVFALALPALGAMGWRARAASGPERRRVRHFLMTFAVLFGVLVVEVLLEALIPAFEALMRTPAGRRWGGIVIYGTQLALPLTTAYVVLRSDVFTVRVAVLRALRYLLARALILWGTAVPLVLLAGYLFVHRDEPLAASVAQTPATVLLWAAAAGTLLMALRTRLLLALDRWALPGLAAPAAVLAHLSQQMKHARTPLEVTTLFARAAGQALQASADAYLLRDHQLVPTLPDSDAPGADSVIPVLLAGAREPCIVAPRHRQSFYDLLLTGDRRWVDDRHIAVLAPVVSGRGRAVVVGVVALQDRRNALAFSADDLRFLSAGCAAAGLACDMLGAETPAQDADADAGEFALECRHCGRVDPWLRDAGPCACGGPRQPASLPHRLASRFEIAQRLGAGGMGIVYRGTDLALGRDVAIKSLTRLTDEMAARLVDEARTMAALSHQHVAVLYGIERWRRTPLLIMEYLGGGTLSARLRRGPLPVNEAVALVRALAEALDHLHGSGRIHGDIKPSNIGFTDHGLPKFLDFGLSGRPIAGAAAASETLVWAHDGRVLTGTPAYLSPEVRAGAPAGPALDLWALCLVLWESITGRHPLMRVQTASDVARAIDNAAPALRTRAGGPLCALLVSALSVSPQERPQSGVALARALEGVMRT